MSYLARDFVRMMTSEASAPRVGECPDHSAEMVGDVLGRVAADLRRRHHDLYRKVDSILRLRELPQRVCPYCDKLFRPHRSWQVYCEPSHQIMAKQRRLERKRKVGGLVPKPANQPTRASGHRIGRARTRRASVGGAAR